MLPTNPPIHIYIKRINIRLVFKIKDGYKSELRRPETMKPFGSTKTKYVECRNSWSSFEVVDVLYIFKPN